MIKPRNLSETLEASVYYKIGFIANNISRTTMPRVLGQSIRKELNDFLWDLFDYGLYVEMRKQTKEDLNEYTSRS